VALLIVRYACLGSKFCFVNFCTLEVGLRLEDSQRVVQAVKLHELLDDLSCESRLGILTQLPR